MDDPTDGQTVTILIPHYQTIEPIRLCLRSLRRFTEHPYRVVVLDQGSTDQSLDYLRSLSWIELKENVTENDPGGSHAASLNIGVEETQTPYFLTLHSDVYFRRQGWLSFLVNQLDDEYAAVGSRHQTIPVTTPWRVLVGVFRRRHARELAPGVPRMRSVCSLYRTAPFKASGCRFLQDQGQDPSHSANKTLVEHGYKIRALPAMTLGRYIFHESGTTLITNELYVRRNRESHLRQQLRYRQRPEVQAILNDRSADG